MESLTAVYVANIFGIALLSILLVSNWGRLHEKTDESRFLLLMTLSTFLGCVIDPIVNTFDGQPGGFSRFLVLVGNALLYLADMFSSFFWFFFLTSHLQARISLTHRYILQSAMMLGISIIIVNFFMPLVFDVNENNNYARQAGYWMYCFIDYSLMLDSLVTYLICRHKGGPMKTFPICVYFAPVVAGTVMQSIFYGISVISASITVAIAGIIASLQSERIYKDKLTGTHNNAYLARFEKQISKNKKQNITGIMINLNGFKKINKAFGRTIANEALKNAANIIVQSVGDLGSVVRYTSDEFIAFINTQDEMAINMCIASIKSGFSGFNQEPKNPYKLSACFSSCEVNFEKSMDYFIEIVSKRMHEEKIEFYSQGENNRRRS